MWKRVAIFFIVAVAVIGSCAPKISKKDLSTDFAKKKILGFTQFSVYRNNSLLGYVPSGEKKFNFKVWEGMMKRDKVRQSITIRYHGKGAYQFSAKFFKIAEASLKRHNVTTINLRLINPVEYILKNPFPAYVYQKRADFLKRRYIGSLLRVKKIKVEFVQKNGLVMSGKVALAKFSVSGKYAMKEKENAVYFAENVYVGYKLFDPPKNAKSLAPFSFDYQFLHRPKGSDRWQLLQPHDLIRSGDHIKCKIRASHMVYVYLFNLDSGGNVAIMFPNKGAGYTNPIQAGQIYHFPKEETLAYQVDNVIGIEEFVFMVFRYNDQRIIKLINKIKQGGMTKQQFQKESVFVQTRGVGKISRIKVVPKNRVKGFNFSVKQIKGLAADYKDTFMLRHEQ